MALKFLNKKGWHTGSLRNIERVWKAERTRDEEDKKLEELRKQISQEREKAEFRALQERAGLQPRQERLDFLYESGLAVGKSSSEGFKELQPAPPLASSSDAGASSSKDAVPGALFEDKPQSANDAWRKLHSDPLLLIRQREQEALERIKNNPIKMAMIKKSVEAEKQQMEEKKHNGEKRKHKKHHHDSKSSKRKEHHSGTNSDSESAEDRRREPSYEHKKESKSYRRKHLQNSSDSEAEDRRKRPCHSSSRQEEQVYKDHSYSRYARSDDNRRKHSYSSSHHHEHPNKHKNVSDVELNPRREGYERSSNLGTSSVNKDKKDSQQNTNQGPRRRGGVQKMSEEERVARLREMQVNAELHEEQRWTRVKRAAVADADEVAKANEHKGKTFLDEAQKSIYGAEKGGSTTIEESVRRRVFYSQGGTDAHERNAFRR